MIHRLTLDEQHEVWQRAIERAIAHNCEQRVSHVCTAQVEGYESTFDVKSASRPGVVYFVQLLVKHDKREAVCDCAAGQNGVICWHMAAAALIAGMLTQPDPDPEPDPEPVEAMKKLSAAEFSIGDVLSGAYREALAAGALS
ncbi:hypothetical protein BH23CHL2_BH23CHL2_07750 [soil metagenome]